MTVGLANKRGRPPRLTPEWLEVCRRLREGQNFSYKQIADHLPFEITKEAVRLALTKEEDPGTDTSEAFHDQPAEQVESNHEDSTSVCSATTTSGDKAS